MKSLYFKRHIDGYKESAIAHLPYPLNPMLRRKNILASDMNYDEPLYVFEWRDAFFVRRRLEVFSSKVVHTHNHYFAFASQRIVYRPVTRAEIKSPSWQLFAIGLFGTIGLTMSIYITFRAEIWRGVAIGDPYVIYKAFIAIVLFFVSVCLLRIPAVLTNYLLIEEADSLVIDVPRSIAVRIVAKLQSDCAR